jgi:hypothetical protein
MVESIYFLKPAWCGAHFADLRPEQGLQPVTRATALRRWFSLMASSVHTVAEQWTRNRPALVNCEGAHCAGTVHLFLKHFFDLANLLLNLAGELFILAFGF